MKRLALMFALLALPHAALASAEPAGEHGGEHADAHGAGHHEPPKPINWFELDWDELDTEGREIERGGRPMNPPLGLMIMNFGVFAAILVWKGGPPIKNYLRQRHIDIKEALEEGQRLRDEAKEKLAEYSDKIAGVEKEVEALIAEVRTRAEEERKRIISEAETQAENMIAAADQQIAAEVERARGQLEREVMTAAIAAAEKLVREKATAADHQTLIDGFLDDLEKADTPSAPETRS